MIPLTLYVHFPWCVKKCPYCDFNSHPLRDSAGRTRALPETAYLDALLVDLDSQLESTHRFESVFFGGGTPSLFAPEGFGRLLARIRPQLTRGAEVTMEANPGATEHHDLEGYRAAGINRLSLGAQSFDPAQLRALGRIHGADDTAACLEAARAAGFDNVNLDLMYGLPGQTVAGALDDLDRALTLQPDHVSWYQLTIEPRTAFAVRRPRLPAEARILEMEAEGRARLEAGGYTRYEVSAYARRGRESRHNLNYWAFGDYLGIGAGAHGKRTRGAEVVRTEKVRQPRLYQRAPATLAQRTVTAAELPAEFMMNALRLVRGVPTATFEERTGVGFPEVADLWRDLAAQGLVRKDRIVATPRGLELLDLVVARFL